MAAAHQIDAQELGIDLSSKSEGQAFRWFLACLLFGKPIQQSIAKRAYETITDAGITSLNKLAKADWNTLVTLLDTAHYVRYDFSTATKLIQISKELKKRYGTISSLLKQSESLKDLENSLTALRGIGPVTASIFIRGVAPVWLKNTTPHEYDSATRAAGILNRHGFAAYIIGGAVRDLWLGRTPKDFDLVTNATPEQIVALPEFKRAYYKDTAQAFGVTRAKLLDKDTASMLEIATFRRDIEAHRGRKYTKVAFASLEDDVMRRDFTINALVLDLATNFIVDYVGGVEDLSSKTIRFIGKAPERIREDPLRIMRAVRFKNQLGFSYHPNTFLAIKSAAKHGAIEAVAVDRLREELTKLLIHSSRHQALLDLDEFTILERVLPEVTAGKGVRQPPQFHAEGDVWQHEHPPQFHAEGDVWQHELLILDYLPEKPSKRLAWAALLHDIGKGPTSTKPSDGNERIRFDRHYAVGAEMAKTTLKRLRFSNHDVKEITWMIYSHMTIDDLPNMRPSHRQRMLGHPAFEDLLELHRADAAASWRPGHSHMYKPRFKSIERIWHEYQSDLPEQRQPSLKRDLGIDGNWLIANFGKEFNLAPGPLIGKVLQKLDECYKDEGVTDTKALLALARRLIKAQVAR